MKLFTREEVLQHNTIRDCWVIINNGVYDLTDFIEGHPGGAEIIETRAGGDASSYFLVKHRNNKDVIRYLESFRIGEIVKEQQISTGDFEDPFLAELVEKCYEQELYTTPVKRNNKVFYIRILNIAVFFAASLLALYGPVHWSLAIVLVLFQALIGTSLFGLIAHEVTHRNFPKNKLLKYLVTFSWPIFWPFIVKNPLRYEHNCHHVKIGDPEFDYEVAAFAPFIRYSGSVRHRSVHRYQHRLARYFYPFYANIITTFGAFTSKYWNKHNRADLSEQGISLLVTAIYFVGIPSIIGGSPVWYLLLYMVYQCTLFYGIYVGAAINHFVPAVMEPIPEEYSNNYAYYICHNTTNFCTSSPFWTWYTGGFNIQIEHHLIPFIPVDNLHKMIPIVKGLCKKYGYPYRDYIRFGDLWSDHYAFLQQLSHKTDDETIQNEIRNKKSYQPR